ncbi:MAG: chemotaxis protein CheW [Oligoflexus sp.]
MAQNSEWESTLLSNFAEGTRYLAFSLGEEEYAIPLLVVKEVIAVPEMTPIPHTPPHFLGIMNLRGQVISVIDLRRKFNIKNSSSDDTAIIICDLSPLTLGVMVDTVNSVLTPEKNELSPKPEMESYIGTEYIDAVYRKENSLILLLDIAKALDSKDKAAIEKSKTNNAA